ncbi:MAG: Gfo/Idh/MocA family protein, partial [Planctomycetota bacterium]
QVTFHNRFYPATLKAKELAEGGFLGDVLAFRAAYLHAGSVDPERPFRWRFSKAVSGGGALYDLGSHTIDLVRHLVGEFADVCCATSIARPDRPAPGDPSKRIPVDVDDAAFMLVRTEPGALGSIESSRIASGTQDELRFEIHGRQGAMRFNLMDPNWLDVCDLTADRPGWTRLPTVQSYPGSGGFIPGKASIGWVRAHVACLHNFVAAAALGEPAEPGLEVGARVQEIMDAGYRSAESGGWVSA